MGDASDTSHTLTANVDIVGWGTASSIFLS